MNAWQENGRPLPPLMAEFARCQLRLAAGFFLRFVPTHRTVTHVHTRHAPHHPEHSMPDQHYSSAGLEALELLGSPPFSSAMACLM
jgi:hypothetical protein